MKSASHRQPELSKSAAFAISTNTTHTRLAHAARTGLRDDYTPLKVHHAIAIWWCIVVISCAECVCSGSHHFLLPKKRRNQTNRSPCVCLCINIPEKTVFYFALCEMHDHQLQSFPVPFRPRPSSGVRVEAPSIYIHCTPSHICNRKPTHIRNDEWVILWLYFLVDLRAWLGE